MKEGVKQSVYIETTIVSYYVSRSSRDLTIAARQALTREWWETKRQNFRVAGDLYAIRNERRRRRCGVMKDPIVEEVRTNRAVLTRECGGTLKSFLAQERDFFAQWKGKKITKPLHPEWCPPTRVGAVAEEHVEYPAKG